MDLDIVTIALNLMMSDYKDNGNIDDTAKQFPASMLLEALVRGKSSLTSVKPAPPPIPFSAVTKTRWWVQGFLRFVFLIERLEQQQMHRLCSS